MEREEQLFVNKLKEELDKDMSGHVITCGECLFYKFIIDADGQLQPQDSKMPKRGQLAFQTDLLIKKEKSNVPLVVIETKYAHFSTHDILTYSTKAVKHKEIYPYLRYGLVVGDADEIHKRFFTHNTGFDFAIAVKSENLWEVTEIIKRQIKDAELLLGVLRDKQKKVKRYISDIELT